MKIRKQLIEDVELALSHLKDPKSSAIWQRAAAKMLADTAAEIMESLAPRSANTNRSSHSEEVAP